MANEARELHACLIRFYARLREQDKTWRDLLKAAISPLECLNKLTEEYRQIKSINMYEIQETIGLEAWERLQYKIYSCIEIEIALLLKIMEHLKKISQDIRKHLRDLQDARSKVFVEAKTMQELVNGTSHRPTLKNLLIWAMDADQYYDEIYSSISNSYDKLDYNKGNSIEDLTVMFFCCSRKKHIQHILACTHFLAEEPLPQASESTDPTKQGKSKG